MHRRTALGAVALGALTGPLGVAAASSAAPSDQLPARADIVSVLQRVNDHWIGANTDSGNNNWARATYFCGNMAAYRLTRAARYLNYTVGWAEKHSYGLVNGAATRHADHHCAGQVYLDLWEELGGLEKIAVIHDSVNRMVTSTKRDDWWWVDALHMAMPVFIRLGVLPDHVSFLVAGYQLYHHTKRLQLDAQSRVTGLYSEFTPLWYRDANYAIDGQHARSPNGKPVFWSRGNGWAMAAHAKVLKAIPHNDKRGPEYIFTLQSMAAALRPIQRADGFWNVNLGDPAHFGGPETSGTAFFAFSLAYGIRAGLLDRTAYLPVLARAWNGMVTTAVHSDGFLGYCQGPGAGPAAVDPARTTDFGVGAFLMAGAEIAALAG